MAIEKKILNLQVINKLNEIAQQKNYERLKTWVRQLEKSNYDVDYYKGVLEKVKW